MKFLSLYFSEFCMAVSVIVLLIIVIIAVKRWLNLKAAKIKTKELENSEKYKKLQELEKELTFYREPVLLKLDALPEFKKYDKKKALAATHTEIGEKYKFLEDNHFLGRLKQIDAIQEDASGFIAETQEMIMRDIARAINTPVKVVWSYTSPKGLRNYSKFANVTREELREYEENPELYEDFDPELERKKLTPGLRYDIMKRDNFRCQICGRTQKDGVTLEVDHIKPISKGGKTEPNNLRTLCWDCNRGKADKYNEDDDW